MSSKFILSKKINIINQSTDDDILEVRDGFKKNGGKKSVIFSNKQKRKFFHLWNILRFFWMVRKRDFFQQQQNLILKRIQSEKKILGKHYYLC